MDTAAARLRHLDRASALLSVASPAISRHLQITSKDIIAENTPKDPSLSSRSSCSACGNMMILGWSCSFVNRVTTDTRRRKTKPHRKRPARMKDAKNVELKCSACGHINRSRVEKPQQTRSKTPSVPAKAQSTPQSIETPFVSQPQTSDQEKQFEPPASTNTKKRARGKKASLEAMLAKSKANTPAAKSSGFDMMDFMKS